MEISAFTIESSQSLAQARPTSTTCGQDSDAESRPRARPRLSAAHPSIDRRSARGEQRLPPDAGARHRPLVASAARHRGPRSMTTPTGELAQWLARLDGVRQRDDEHIAQCPVHEEKHASLSLREKDDGGVPRTATRAARSTRSGRRWISPAGVQRPARLTAPAQPVAGVPAPAGARGSAPRRRSSGSSKRP